MVYVLRAPQSIGLLAALSLLLFVRTTSGQVAASSSITGHVTNAVSGAPIPRVLVQFGSAAAFTDHDGTFVLGDATAGGGMIMLTKPGYFTSPERTDAPGVQVSATQLTQPLDVRLYPEALFTGFVFSQDGAPLRAVQVTARRLVTEDGIRRFEATASTQTDSHGAFRLPVPAGEYQVATQFVASSAETGLAILPAVAPSIAGGGTVHVGSGEQQQLELRPHTGVPHIVSLAVDGISEGRTSAVRVSTANGEVWPMDADSDRPAIRLPSGSYYLSITSRDGDGLFFGEARLAVPDHDVAGPHVQLAPVAPIPVEVSVDAHASSNSPPSLQELGLQLLPEPERDPSQNGSVHLETRRGRTPGFFPAPGRFLVFAAPRSSWYIESVSYGGIEVLGQTLTVNPGSGASALRILVNDVVGSVEGKVTFSRAAMGAWIALIPTFPTATPMLTLRAAADGSFSRSSLQPGTYLALALEHRTVADLADPEVRSSLGLRTQTITVEPGTKTTVDLQVLGGGS